jgi:subtilisin family serine protease
MKIVAVALALLLLAGCGGDDGPTNSIPTISVTSPVAVNDGVTTVADVSVGDKDVSDVLTVTLGGSDASQFSISASNQLSFSSAPIHAAPADANADNAYELTLNIADGNGGTASAGLTVNVINLLTGRVVDPPLSGSTVFIDLDSNLLQDSNEASVLSDAEGNFAIPDTTAACQGTGVCGALLVAFGGTDITTGQTLPNFAVFGPASADAKAILSPVSSLLHVAADDQAVLTALGITVAPADIATTDPWAGSINSDAAATQLLQVNLQIGLIAQTIESFEPSSSASGALASRLLESIVAVGQTGGAVNLADTATVSGLLQSSTTTTLTEPAVAAVASTLADVNRVITDGTLVLTGSIVKEILQVAQDNLQKSVVSLSAGLIQPQEFEAVSSAQALLVVAGQAVPLTDTDGDERPDLIDLDDDGDGVVDVIDVFPLDSTESIDTDIDGTGNNADTDDDGDGVADTGDALPLDKNESLDTDGDGTGNNADTDDDGDGVADTGDTFPLDKNESVDTDADGTGNNADTDDDGDSVADTDDAFPLDKNESVDTDDDGTGNNADTDDDNDGVADTGDIFPLDKNESLDTDADGAGNNVDADDDGDGVADAGDALPLDRNESVDTDGDGIGNNADTDDDGDSVLDAADAFPLDKNESLDTDADGTGNNVDTDDDGDGVADASDALPLDNNESVDTDGDGMGDNADTDDDGDSVLDTADAFPLDKNESLDTDTDGTGNNADTDDDGDGILDVDDSDPLVATGTPPTVSDLALTLNLLPTSRSTQTGTMVASSEENLALTHSIVAQGNLGVATVTNAITGAFSYESLAGTATAGTDTFTFKVNDGIRDSATGTVTVSLNTDPLYQHQWHLDNAAQKTFALNPGVAAEDLNVDSVIATGLTGKGIIIAILDEDLELAHEDLAGNIVAGGSFNYLNSTTDPTLPAGGTEGHGTSVAGLAAARGWNNTGGRGVAPLASLKGFNILKGTTFQDDLESIGGATYSADVSIFNQSFGVDSRIFVPPLATIIEDQYKASVTSLRGGKGAIFVRSSGNGFTGYEGAGVAADCDAAIAIKISCQNAVMDPSMALPQIITVGALDANGKVASYSTAGSSIWISAPGGEDGRDGIDSLESDLNSPAMLTTDRTGCTQGSVRTDTAFPANVFQNASLGDPALNPGCKYTSTFNGTSSAAPVLSGAIALILEARPELTWRDIKQVLQRTAKQVEPSRAAISVALGDGNYIAESAWTTNAVGVKFHNVYGFGGVDVAAAVSLAKAMTPNNLGTFVETTYINSGVISVAIPDTSIAGASSAIAETSDLTIESVRISVDITHPSSGDLGVELTSPSGTRSVLFTIRNGFSSSDDLRMEMMSNAFYDEPSNGTWTLKVVDGKTPDGGILNSWAIKIYGH